MKNKKKENLDERHALMGELKNLIKNNLEFCDEKSTPYLCAYKSTPQGYADVEAFVIKAFFETNMSVSDALVQKENMLNPNYLTD